MTTEDKDSPWDKYSDIDPFENDRKKHPDYQDLSYKNIDRLIEMGIEDEEDVYGKEPSDWDDDLLTDSNHRQYNPYGGSQSPTKGRCNATLRNYMERYGEIRYCSAIPMKFFDKNAREHPDFCRHHQSRGGLMKDAERKLEHGAFAKTAHGLFEKLDPQEQLLIVGVFESLLDDSHYNFDYSYDDYELNTDEEEDECLIEFPVPTEKIHRAIPLWQASVDLVKRERIQEKIFEQGIEGESVSHTGTNEAGMIVDERTEMVEHHLNLPYSRLVKDHERNLKLGGVVIADEDDSVEVTFDWKDDIPSPEDVRHSDVPLEIEKEEKE